MSIRTFASKKQQSNQTREYLERLNLKIQSNQLFLQDRDPNLFQKSLPEPDKFIRSDTDIIKHKLNSTSVAESLLVPITDPFKIKNIVDKLNELGYLDIFNQHFDGILRVIKKRYTTINADMFIDETIKYLKNNVIVKSLDDRAREKLEGELEDLDIEERKRQLLGTNIILIYPKESDFKGGVEFDGASYILEYQGQKLPMKRSTGKNPKAKIKSVRAIQYEDASPKNLATILNIDENRLEIAMEKKLGRDSNNIINWKNLLGQGNEPKKSRDILLGRDNVAGSAASPSPGAGSSARPTGGNGNGKPKLISIGKGDTDNQATIQIMKQRRNNCNTWTDIGNLRICLSKLYSNELSVQYLKTKHRLKNIPIKKAISNEFKEILLDLVDSKPISNTFLKSINNQEQLVLRNILHYSGLMNKYKEISSLLMTEEEEITRLENLKNSLLMGNNNDSVKKEFKNMVLDFGNNGKISYKQVVNLLSIL